MRSELVLDEDDGADDEILVPSTQYNPLGVRRQRPRKHSPIPFPDIDDIIEESPPRRQQAPVLNTSSPPLPSAPLFPIVDIDEFPELPLYSNSQKPTESQVAPKSSATTTRTKRGVTKAKSRAQKELESQERFEAKIKADNKNKREKAAAARKVAKTMKPRKEDVSQLADALEQMNSSP